MLLFESERTPLASSLLSLSLSLSPFPSLSPSLPRERFSSVCGLKGHQFRVSAIRSFSILGVSSDTREEQLITTPSVERMSVDFIKVISFSFLSVLGFPVRLAWSPPSLLRSEEKLAIVQTFQKRMIQNRSHDRFALRARPSNHRGGSIDRATRANK